MRNKRAIYKHMRNKFCPREILRLVILGTAEYCCQLKMSVDRGTHNTGFQFGAPRLVQEGCVMYHDDDEERMFPWFRIGQAQEVQVVWFCSALDPVRYWVDYSG